MSDKEEHELRCGESFPRSAPKPRRSTATSARCSFPSRQNQRSASVNLPKHLAGAILTFS